MISKSKRVEGAKAILAALGLPEAQQNEQSAFTLIALAEVDRSASWLDAKRRSIGIHDILIYLKDKYKQVYAENTRETVRRQVLHQFVQARVADYNPDNPSLPTNSPRAHYALTEDALRVIRAYGTDQFASQAKIFKDSHGSLLDLYRAERKLIQVPVALPSGKSIDLSPGKHNELQRDIVEKFAPRFAPGTVLLYLGDTSSKLLIYEKDILDSFNIPSNQHDKLPDVLLLDKKRKWLFLIEAVTSHGPVSPKRKHELDSVLSLCSLKLVYVSAFPDFTEFKSHLKDIAWETEVWIAEIADHMIHFNGDKFLK